MVIWFISASSSVCINSYMCVFGSSTEVRALLKEYFDRSHDLAHQDQELYILCIQCFEVRLDSC